MSANRIIDKFLVYLKKADLSRQTVTGYHQDLQNFYQWFNSNMHGKIGLEKLTSIDIVNYRQHLLNIKRLKPATINRHLNAIYPVAGAMFHFGILLIFIGLLVYAKN